MATESQSVAASTSLVPPCEPNRYQLAQCALGFATRKAISHFMEMHPDVPKEAGNILTADPDTSKPLYFWQLYSVLGTDRIINIVEHLYASIAADDEERWLPRAFERIADWEHHVSTQAGFWLDVMGRGKCYHGGEYRLEFHHTHNAGHVMTQVGAARWMHHMRHALDVSDLGSDPRVRGCIDEFIRTRMEKYAGQFDFQTGDCVYSAWRSEDWERTSTWDVRGPVARCPVTGLAGNCEGKTREISEQSSTSGTGSTCDDLPRDLTDFARLDIASSQ